MKQILPSLTLIVLCISISSQSATAQAAEEILSFRSDIVVNPDSSLNVTETIQVRATGKQIKRGIYRDFPTRYRDHAGNNYVVDFELLETLRDGMLESAKTEAYTEPFAFSGLRIYLGRKEHLLAPGIYSYTIKYRTTRQLGFFRDHDELYWNVTGDNWSFPIRSAEAHVFLPGNATALAMEAYTGSKGAKGQDYRVATGNYGEIVFRSTRSFATKEALTIVVSWPKGLVREPTPEERARNFLKDNLYLLLGLGGLLVVLFYYLAVWQALGVDPAKGTIIPQFDAPKGMSPVEMRYLWKMGYDDKGFAALILNLAVKGVAKIINKEGNFVVSPTEDINKEAELTKLESEVCTKMFWKGKDISFDGKYNPHIEEAQTLLKKQLEEKHLTRSFITNSKYFVFGLILSVIVLIVSIASFFLPAAFIVSFLSVWLSIWTIGVLALLLNAKKAWSVAIRTGKGFGNALFITLSSLPFIGGEIVGLGILFFTVPLAFIFLILTAGGLNFIFYQLLKAPTIAGRKLLDQIEGLRLYLGTAEKERLASMYQPAQTVKVFEKFLPFALALDVEQVWAERFSEVLASATSERGPDGEAIYQPHWYSGRGFSSVGAFATGFGAGFASAISSSSTPPGSRSGAGGRGSSGGGGGGGGGGGW